MDFQINFRSGIPIYTQVADQVRQKLAAGELKPGDQLPTVRQLATDLRVNFNTIARAYRILDEAGLISTQQGRGTYIWEPPDSNSLHRLRQESLDNLARHFLAAAARLGAGPDEVENTIRPQLDRWRETGVTPDDE